MNYLELRRDVDQLQKQIEGKKSNSEIGVRAVVISDMPLQPWFELYLQKAWAEKGRIAKLRRVPWQLRRENSYDPEEVLIYWLSSQAAAEADPEREKTGIWIKTETASDPIQLFYPATVQKKDSIMTLETSRASKSFPADMPVIDLEQLMLRIGLFESLAQKESRWGDIYSDGLQREAAREIVRVYETERGRRKKCLVLDCDGVLWGGIISEDGLEGIRLSETGNGQRYYEFQKLLKCLWDHGIILAVCSKNDEIDVKNVFQSHTAMQLKEENIAAWSVNWQPKSRQIEELSRKLQIDLQDMVMVDDSLWELEEVRNSYPQVSTVLFDQSKGLRSVFEQLAEYFYLKPEDQNQQNQLRLQTYADNVKREELRQRAASYEEFLDKLQTKIVIRPAEAADLLRISDLSRRANQCTNGTRYRIEELKQLLQKDYQLLAVSISDIYRDLGLVGCIGIDPTENKLDLFCLSCRALGRKAEQQLLAAVPPKVNKLRWQDTGKNAGLKQMLVDEGRWQFET